MRHLSSFLATFALLSTIGACATSSSGEGLRAGDRGGKADGEAECLSNDELIGTIREMLAFSLPNQYGDIEWNDDLADVYPIEDLNGDGLEDAVLVPGVPQPGVNGEFLIIATEPVEDTDFACHTQFLAHLYGIDAVPTEDGQVTEGMRDLDVSQRHGDCVIETRRWVYNGVDYAQTDDVRYDNVCE